MKEADISNMKLDGAPLVDMAQCLTSHYNNMVNNIPLEKQLSHKKQIFLVSTLSSGNYHQGAE